MNAWQFPMSLGVERHSQKLIACTIFVDKVMVLCTELRMQFILRSPENLLRRTLQVNSRQCIFFLTSHYILRRCVFVTDGCRLVFIKDNFRVIQPCQVFVVKCKVLRRKKLTYFCYFFLRRFYVNLSGRLCCDISKAVCLNFLLLTNNFASFSYSVCCLSHLYFVARLAQAISN